MALINTSRDAESDAKSLSPRERIELLVDPESVLEIAARGKKSATFGCRGDSRGRSSHGPGSSSGTEYRGLGGGWVCSR